MRLRFGAWTFDSDRRELLRGEETVHLSPKAFALLGLLIGERPRVVSKAEISERIWPGTFVSDWSLPVVVAEIRKVLGDSARAPTFVQTKHRFGYAFVHEATEARPGRRHRSTSARAPYRLLLTDRELALTEGENVLGRAPEADLRIKHASVSRRHARVVVRDEGVDLEDLGSRNGTYLCDRRLIAPVRLSDNDLFCVGSVWIRFCHVRDEGDTTTAEPVPSPEWSPPELLRTVDAVD